MFRKMLKINIETENLTMRLPQMIDRDEWINLRRKSADFLMPWEPNWQDDHLTKKSFTQRVEWARKSVQNNTAIP
jgi:ribosomal-protein-alanine N-acetyltransferase